MDLFVCSCCKFKKEHDANTRDGEGGSRAIPRCFFWYVRTTGGDVFSVDPRKESALSSPIFFFVGGTSSCFARDEAIFNGEVKGPGFSFTFGVSWDWEVSKSKTLADCLAYMGRLVSGGGVPGSGFPEAFAAAGEV